MKSTAEQQEAKRKEKEKKLQIFRSTMARIHEKVCGFCVSFVCEVFLFAANCYIRYVSAHSGRQCQGIILLSRHL